MFMLPQYVDNKKNNHIITPFETSLLFTVFLFVLFFLYPRESLEKKVLSEKSNYHLTTIYLKNLITLDPENSDLVFAMANTLHQQEKLDLSRRLLEILESNPNDDVKAKATLLHLSLNHTKLQKPLSQYERSLLLKENKKLLSSVSEEMITDRKKNETLYHAALSLQEKALALKFNLNIIKDKDDKKYLYWLKNAHYLAEEIGEKSKNIEILKTLIFEDKNSSSIWLDALLPQLDKETNLAALSSELQLTDETLAQLYIRNNQALKASEIYISLLNKENNQKVRKKLLLKIITILQANNQTVEAASLALKYEDDYIMDKNMTKKLLKLYLSANRADLAKKFSLKIIKKRKKK